MKTSVLRCSACGARTIKAGASNWKQCNQCMVIFCPGCYRNKLKQSSHHTIHQPWGRWLSSRIGGGEVEFS